jgi:hypothetical protein
MIRQAAPSAAAGRRTEPPVRRFLGLLGGPLLIVAAVVTVTHNVAFGGLVSVPSPDMLPLWLPNHCLLGTSLAHGRSGIRTSWRGRHSPQTRSRDGCTCP